MSPRRRNKSGNRSNTRSRGRSTTPSNKGKAAASNTKSFTKPKSKMARYPATKGQSDMKNMASPKNHKYKSEELVPVLDHDLDESLYEEDEDGKPRKKPNLKGDYWNIALLLVLYTLQGVPIGFASTVPLIMKERGVSYSQIGIFSFCNWPFSLKLLWAPFVDSVYSNALGRRKTWLLPTQLLIGFALIAVSFYFNTWMGGELGSESTDADVDIYPLTAGFFLLYFLCATQDIAVDGWSLTVLREENVGYQSMCNAAGQTFGYAFAFIGALSLEHFEVMSFEMFMRYCGLSFIIVTLLVAIFKREKPVPPDEEVESVSQVFGQVRDMWRVKIIRKVILILCLWKVPWVGCESISQLKMQEKGVPKEHIAYLGGMVTIFSVAVPFFVGKSTSGNRPLDVFMWLYIPRIIMCALACGLVFYCPNVTQMIHQHNETSESFLHHPAFPSLFYFCMIISSLAACFISTAMFCSNMAMWAKVAPKDIAGTYLTMLNTFSNLGAMWVSPFAFFLVDRLTVKEGEVITLDGFYVVSGICGILGLLGFPSLWRSVSELQDEPKSAWAVGKSLDRLGKPMKISSSGKGK